IAMMDGQPVRNAVTMNTAPSAPISALNACMPYMTCVSVTRPFEGRICGVTSVDAMTNSFRLDAVVPDDLAPAGDLRDQELLQPRGTADDEIHSQLLDELVAQVRNIERLYEFGVKFLHDRLGRRAGRKNSPPRERGEAGEALLRQRGHVRKRVGPLFAGDDE